MLPPIEREVGEMFHAITLDADREHRDAFGELQERHFQEAGITGNLVTACNRRRFEFMRDFTMHTLATGNVLWPPGNQPVRRTPQRTMTTDTSEHRAA